MLALQMLNINDYCYSFMSRSNEDWPAVLWCRCFCGRRNFLFILPLYTLMEYPLSSLSSSPSTITTTTTTLFTTLTIFSMCGLPRINVNAQPDPNSGTPSPPSPLHEQDLFGASPKLIAKIRYALEQSLRISLFPRHHAPAKPLIARPRSSKKRDLLSHASVIPPSTLVRPGELASSVNSRNINRSS